MKTVVSKLAYALVLGATLVAATAPSRAEIDYPVCKTGGGDVGIGSGSCKFISFEQCRESSAGYGMCYANPIHAAPAATSAAQRRAKRG
jgi:hypothetical protein